MDYVIVGAGALGQSFAGLLARAGERVMVLATARGEGRLRETGAIRLRGAEDVAVKVGPGGVRVTCAASDVPHGAVVLFTGTVRDHASGGCLRKMRAACRRRAVNRASCSWRSNP